MVTGVGPLYAAIHGQLRALSAAAFAPRERATIAEVMRDQVAHLHTELARRYAGKPQPAAERELDAADQAIALVACAVGTVFGVPEAPARRR